MIKSIKDNFKTKTSIYNSKEINNLFEEINKYDYIMVESDVDLIRYINEKNISICVINLEENKYFCSDKYCLVNYMMYRYNNLSLLTHDYDKKISYSFIANDDKYFIKYHQKDDLCFFEDSIKEIYLLKEFKDSNIDFINKQKIYDYKITDRYSICARKFIDGNPLEKDFIKNLKFDEKIKIITEIFKQLNFLEKNGYLYSDMICANIMIKNKNPILIDLGSYYEKNDNYQLYNFSRLGAYNLLDLIIILIYNLFNVKNDFIQDPIFSLEVLYKIREKSNYEPEIIDFFEYLKRLKYSDNCTYSKIYNMSNKNSIFLKNKNSYEIRVNELHKNNNLNLYQRKQYLDNIYDFIGNKINSIIDIQCGRKENIESSDILRNSSTKYIGIDFNKEIILENRKYFGNDKNKIFINMNAVFEPLPKADLVICDNLLEYLCISDIWTLLENIRDSQPKYVVFTNYHSKLGKYQINSDINQDYKDFYKISRAINLNVAPFYFPTPTCLFPTDSINKTMAFYSLEDIFFFMDYHDKETSYLRSKIFSYLEHDFNKISNIFSKYENGYNLLKAALMADSIDWDKFYYNKIYKDIIDNNDIFIEYVDLLLIIFVDNLQRLIKDRPERYSELLNANNFQKASIIAKDYIFWRYKL